jgi:hypothetical protein
VCNDEAVAVRMPVPFVRLASERAHLIMPRRWKKNGRERRLACVKGCTDAIHNTDARSLTPGSSTNLRIANVSEIPSLSCRLTHGIVDHTVNAGSVATVRTDRVELHPILDELAIAPSAVRRTRFGVWPQHCLGFFPHLALGSTQPAFTLVRRPGFELSINTRAIERSKREQPFFWHVAPQ